MILATGALLAAWSAAAPAAAQNDSNNDETRVFAVLTDWTGNFIGGADQTQRVREESRRRVEELLFPSSGEASPLGFDASRDRLFVARFGLVTDRSGIQPLEDFLQVQLDLDADFSRLRSDAERKDRLARAFDRDRGQLRTADGRTGAQWGFPTLVWTIAVDRINRRAERLGLDFESIVLVLITDDVPNLGKGLASESGACARLLRRYSRPDSQRFEAFYDVYTRELTTRRINVRIDPIAGVGQDGEGLLRAFRIAPGAAGADLNRVFDVDAESFSLRADGGYHGELRLGVDPSPLYPAALGGLRAELYDPRGELEPEALPVADGDTTVWRQLPARFGATEGRDFRLRLAAELSYPEIDELSQFHTALVYDSPVKVEVEGLLKLADGSQLTADRMQGDETPEQARRRIDGFKAVVANFKWAIIAVVLFIAAGIAYYFAAWYRPPLLRLAAGTSATATVNWRDGDEVLRAVPVASVEITNERSRGGVHKEWTGQLEITEVSADHELVTAGGVPATELLSFAADGSSKTASDELAGKRGESVPLFLRADLALDLNAPGPPDADGNYEVALTATLALRSRHETAAETCTLTVPVVFAAPRVRWEAEWIGDEAGERFLYNELCEAPAEVRRLRIFHRAERQALWPVEVRLAVLDPDGRSLRGLHLAAPGDAPEGVTVTGDGSQVRVERFGLRRELEVGIEYSAQNLEPPSQRDTELELRIVDLTGAEPRTVGGPASFRIGLDTQEPWPVILMDAFQDGKSHRIIDFPAHDPPGGVFELDPAYPILSGKPLADPWTLIARLELGNAAERPHPEPMEGGGEDPGRVNFQLGRLEIHTDLEDSGMSAENLERCFRVVKRADRERDSAQAKSFLGTEWPFGTLEPGPGAAESYQLELDQLGFDRLTVDTAEIELTLHFEGFVRDDSVARFSQRFRLPLIANYGDNWFLMDIGTSTIVAMSMSSRLAGDLSDASRLLELMTAATNGQDPRLLPSTLFIEKDAAAEGGYRLEFRDSPDEVGVTDAYRLLPPFKLLVGSKRLPLKRPELKELELDEAPPVDDILRKALATLLERYVKPALRRGVEDDEAEMPRQVLLPIPNTFTPAHVALIRDLFRDELGARRVVFLSESDAICWRYLTLVQDGQESLPERFHQGLEYVLIVDVGAGTTDLTYMAIARRGVDEIDHATILHRDGFRVAGNNVDTCLGRIVHHKLASLNTLDESPFVYDARQQIFHRNGAGKDEERLEERFLYPIVLRLREMKADLAENPHQSLRLRVSSDILFKQQYAVAEDGDAQRWVRSWLKMGVGEGQRSNDIRLEAEEVLHAPGYSRLVHGEMSAQILRHFFAGCPTHWQDAPEDWCGDGRFPVDTLIMTGRGGLTPGLRPAIESTLEAFRLPGGEGVRQPSFSRNGTPEELKLAVIEGVRDYIQRFGPESGLGNRGLVRDRGLYEDYYLYTGPGRSFKRKYKLLDREDHQVTEIGGDTPGSGPALRRFTSAKRPVIPFTDSDGAVLVVATSSRTPPDDPKRPDTFIRPLCQFSQENRNREVEIFFEVDSNHNFRLLVDGTDIGGREHRYESELFEELPGVLENMWPGRPCDPGDASVYYSPRLPRAGEAPEPRAPEEEAPEEEVPQSIDDEIAEEAVEAAPGVEEPIEEPIEAPPAVAAVNDAPPKLPPRPAPQKSKATPRKPGPKIGWVDLEE